MKAREHWGSRVGFLLATAGSAIGLGSLWKFPYVTGKYGGGLFVLIYLFLTFLIGVPIFMGELVIGRSALACPVNAFGELSMPKRSWQILGWTSCFAPLLVFSFYCVVSGWALNYALMSLLNFSAGKSDDQIREAFQVLFSSFDINLLWTTLFLLVTTGVVYKGIRQGIEFWSKILMPLLLIFLLLLLAYSATLSGFKESFFFVFAPHAEKMNAAGFLEALGLACFTLSVGMGVIITYGSYMKQHEDIPKTAFVIAMANLIVSVLAAMMIFPIIFTFHFPSIGGPGLLFETMPVLFAKLPGTLITSTIFFLLVVFAALTSTISLMEVLVATATEVYGISRGKSCFLVALLTFILSIPSASSGSSVIFPDWALLYGKNFFTTVDSFAFSWLLPINVLFTSIFLGYFMDKHLRQTAFSAGCKWPILYKPWLFFVRIVVPLAILLILLQGTTLVDFDTLFR